MDRFTRNYAVVLGALVVLIVGAWLASRWDPAAARPNTLLEAHTSLAAYPYVFRVVSVDDGIATLHNRARPAMRWGKFADPLGDDRRSLDDRNKPPIDRGLLDNPAVADPAQAGRFKVPTLRNVAVTGPYRHNGVFGDLRTVVLFYN